MKKSTKLIIGAALVAGGAVLFVLSQPKANNPEEEQVEAKVLEQKAAEPEQETQLNSEPEVAPKPEVEPSEETAEEAVVESEESQEEPSANPWLAMVDEVEDPAGKVRVLSSLATVKLHAGEAAVAKELLGQALDLIEELDDAKAKLGLLETLSTSLGDFGKLEELAEVNTRLVALSKQLKNQTNPLIALVAKVEDPAVKVRVLNSLAMAKLHAGEAAMAQEPLGQALDLIEELDDAKAKLGLMEKISDSLEDFKELKELAELNARLASMTEQLENQTNPAYSLIANVETPEHKVRVLARLAGVLSRVGNAKQAASMLEQAQTITAEIEGPEQLSALVHIGVCLIHMGQEEDALKQIGGILSAVDKLEETEAQIGTLVGLVDSLDEFREQKSIQPVIEKASARVEALQQQGDPILRLVGKIDGAGGRARVLCNLAGTLAQTGDTDQASAMLTRASEFVALIEDNTELAPALTHMAVAQARMGLAKESKKTLALAMDAMKKLESVDAKAVVLANIATAINESNDREQTQAILTQSVEIAGEIQKRAEAVMQRAITMANQLQDGEQKAAAIQQIVNALEQDGIGHFTQLQFDLATLYHEGRHLPKDAVRAAKWYRKAAAQGHAPAQINLAMMHLGGDGVKTDPSEARKWFTQAADQGDAEGQVALGMMFALGQGVEADLVQAHKWVSLAAGQGNEDAQTALKQLVTKLTPEQLVESSKLANEWQDKRKPQPSAQIPPSEAPKTAEK
ncbi:MAG: hypothetical protein QF685_04525 [Verrucomicrobiota bacterium]|jgi:TPR repeat protein|nr:hypothetical protein [Verrucomicrobiota bacterium]